MLIFSAAIRPEPFAPYRILRTKVPGLGPAMIYRDYEFESLVCVTKKDLFYPDWKSKSRVLGPVKGKSYEDV